MSSLVMQDVCKKEDEIKTDRLADSSSNDPTINDKCKQTASITMPKNDKGEISVIKLSPDSPRNIDSPPYTKGKKSFEDPDALQQTTPEAKFDETKENEYTGLVGYSEEIKNCLPVDSIGREILLWLKKKKKVFSADIHQLLTLKKAFLILPADSIIQNGRKFTINRPFVEEHVVMASSLELFKPLRTLTFATVVMQEKTLLVLESNVKFSDIEDHQHQHNFLSLFGNAIISSIPECPLDGCSASVVIVKDVLIKLPPEYIKSEMLCDELRSQFAINPETSREIAKRLLRVPKTIATEESGVINSELQELYELVQGNKDAQDLLEKWICDNGNLKLGKCLHGEDIALEKRFSIRARILANAGIQLQQLDPTLASNARIDALLEATDTAGKIMAALIDYSSPAEKMHALMQAQDLLSHDMGADVLLPLLIYTLIYHPPESLVAQLRYIQAYRRPGGLEGAAEYCITNLVAGIAYIDTFDLPSLGIYENDCLESPFHLDPKDSPSSTSSFSNSLKSLSTLPIDMTGEGVRALTGVMDMMVGRFWNTAPPPLPPRRSDTVPVSPESSAMESLIPRNESLDYFFKKKFLDSSFENLTVADLQELLEDYKQLEKMLIH